MRSLVTLKCLIACLLFSSFACNSTTSAIDVPSSRPALANEVTAARIAKDVYFLASDELEGRGIGSDGLEKAAEHIAARFKALGMRPLPGRGDFYQPFYMNTAASVDPSSSLKIGETSYRPVSDFSPVGFTADSEFSGDVVFAGYGITNPDHQYNDYANIDVKGKVVLILRFEPHNQKGTSRFADEDWSTHAELGTKARLAAERGASAILMVNPAKYHGPDVFVPVTRGGTKSDIPFIHIKREVAEEILRQGGSTRSLVELQTAIDTSGNPHSFALTGVTASGKAAVDRRRVQVRNVMAYLPGGKRPDEYIVVGAHYDHLGMGGESSLARGSVQIHNGADDNASGTATVLALAEQIVYAGRVDRSVIFILFSGEESGLLGSQHFVNNPPVPLEQIVAMINMDMVGRIRNNLLYVGGSGTAEAFDAILKAADADSPLQLKEIGRGGRGPSDHQNFSMKNIPVLFLFSGMHSDYHKPSDDADKVNYSGLAEVVELSHDIIVNLATMPRQQYVAKFDGHAGALSGVGSRGSGVTLGVVPDYGTDESTSGVRITGTTPGTPAEAAGLRDGDVIVAIGDKNIQNLYDLTEFLNASKPGDKVTVVVERDGQRLELPATLKARKG